MSAKLPAGECGSYFTPFPVTQISDYTGAEFQFYVSLQDMWLKIAKLTYDTHISRLVQ